MKLSRSTTQCMAKLLLQCASAEKQIEVVRQVLCDLECFHPYTSFKRIAGRAGLISANDLHTFLASCKFHLSMPQCEMFIANYDLDGDSALSYTEFLVTTLPIIDERLREKILLKSPMAIDDAYVEYTVSKLISKEVALTSELEPYKKELQSCFDYSPSSCFDHLDQTRKMRLTCSDLHQFFASLKIDVLEEELVLIFRRIDRSNDGFIDLQELHFFLGDQIMLDSSNYYMSAKMPYSCKVNGTKNPKAEFDVSLLQQKSQSQKNLNQQIVSGLKQNEQPKTPRKQDEEEKGGYESQTKKKPATAQQRQNKLANKTPPRKPGNQKQTTPAKQSTKQLEKTPQPSSKETKKPNRMSSPPNRINAAKSPPPNKKTPQATNKQQAVQAKKQSTPSLNPGNKKQLTPVKDSKKGAKQNKNKTKGASAIEAVEMALPKGDAVFSSRQSAFAISSIIERELVLEMNKQRLAIQPDFNIFDAFRAIDKEHLGCVSCLDFDEFIPFEPGTTQKLVARYGLNGSMRFSDFLKMIQPYSAQHARLIYEKTPINSSLSVNEIFSSQTMVMYKTLLDILLSVEVNIERARVSLRPSNLKNLFEKIDAITQDGYLTIGDLQAYFNESDFFYTKQQLELFIARIDRDNDGKISLEEFLKEFQFCDPPVKKK